MLRVGGFDEDVVFFEESTIKNKLQSAYKVTIKRIESEILHIEEGATLIDWCRKKSNYAKTLKVYVKRYPEHAAHLTSVRNRFMIYL